MATKDRRGLLIAAVIGSLLVFAPLGCGSSTASTGSLRVSVQWQADVSRLVPSTAQAVVIVVHPASGPDQTIILTRPSSGTFVTTGSFGGLAPGTATLTITAYPYTDPSALGLAVATITDGGHTITVGQTINVSLVMASTVDHVVISPNTAQVTSAAGPYHTTNLTALAVDAGNRIIVAASNWTWSTSAASTASVSGSSTNAETVTGAANGNGVTITATEGESGKSGTAKVDVVSTLSAPTSGGMNVSVSR